MLQYPLDSPCKAVSNKKPQWPNSKEWWAIAKDWLVHQGVNIQRFKRTQSCPETGERRVRRKKFRGLGGKWKSYFLFVIQGI